MGQLAPQELHSLYKISNIGVLPSYSEESSYVAIEMMMYGLPIVSSNGRGLNNMFIHNKNALIASVGKSDKTYIENLKNTFIQLLSSQEVCFSLGKEAKKTFEKEYEISHMINRYEKVLKLFIHKQILLEKEHFND